VGISDLASKLDAVLRSGVPYSWMKLRLRKALISWEILIFLFASAAGLAQSQVKPSAGNLSLLQDAAQSLAAGDLKRAESTLDIVLATAPDDFRALNLLGIIRAEQHRESDAEKLFNQAIKLKPDSASAHVSLGMLYVQMSTPERAIPQFQEALRLDAGRSDARASLIAVWRDEAHAAVRENDPEKALSLLLQARKISAQDPDVLYDFGMVALSMSLLPDALQAFKDALDLRKDDANTLYALGRTQVALANYEDARVTFDRYGQLHREDASGHYALGMTLEALQRTADARDEFEKSIALQPAQTESYFQLGRIELEAGNLGAADAQFARVLNRDPHHAGALGSEGRLKFEQKEYTQALDLLQKAIVLDSSLREAHYYLGMTYARMNRKGESDTELAVASRLEHEEVERHQNLIRIIDAEPAPAAKEEKK
jgi:tetratricopeptide (TPR) repeat protein